jgi:hypothetical protein
MKKSDPMIELFDTLIEDELENKIMKLFINGKNDDQILKELLGIKSGNCKG